MKVSCGYVLLREQASVVPVYPLGKMWGLWRWVLAKRKTRLDLRSLYPPYPADWATIGEGEDRFELSKMALGVTA